MDSIAFVMEKEKIFCEADQYLLVSELIIQDELELVDKSYAVINAYKVYKWLIINEKILPSKIYFPQKGALGFFAIQAQKTGQYFSNIEFVVIPNGTTLQDRQRNGEWGEGKVYDLKLSYMEDYCIRYVKKIRQKIETYPLVSVCISHYNHGKYLPQTLEALAKNRYPNLEVLIVDANSKDPFSVKVLKEMEEKYRGKFDFYYKENKSLGDTRNDAVSFSKGEYIIFVDSDNLPNEDMIQNYVEAMKQSECDCLTCHNTQFAEGANDRLFMPIGPAIEYGLFENCFGDAGFCIKKSVFQEIGGFTSERYGLEDWEFLAKLSLRGYQLDVIPRSLYRYRRSQQSMSNTVNQYQSTNRVLRVYTEGQPEYIRVLVSEFCIPIYKNGWKQYLSIDETSNPVGDIYMSGIYISLINKIDKLLPKGSYRREFIKKIFFIKKV